ncbi:gas vesicle protein [Psychromonas ingrahamii]|nr:gas vesicle protein [Psychromonas ingrahamii]
MANVSINPELTAQECEKISLCDALDRIINKGVVIHGEITISVANVDLISLGVRLILSNVETREQSNTPKEEV